MLVACFCFSGILCVFWLLSFSLFWAANSSLAAARHLSLTVSAKLKSKVSTKTAASVCYAQTPNNKRRLRRQRQQRRRLRCCGCKSARAPHSPMPQYQCTSSTAHAHTLTRTHAPREKHTLAQVQKSQIAGLNGARSLDSLTPTERLNRRHDVAAAAAGVAKNVARERKNGKQT